MEFQKQRRLDEEREDFARGVPFGAKIWEKLASAGWTITRARRTAVSAAGTSSWLLYLQPSDMFRRRFELAPEVLACVSPFETAQAREVDEVEAELARTHRLDRGIVLVLSMDARAARELEAVLPEERCYLFATFDDLLDAPDPQHWTAELLVNGLGMMRPFAPGAPVADAQFFGRQSELQELERRLLQMATPVGLVGLRKVGKTSLLQRFRRKVEDDADEHGPATLVVHCDAQAVPFTRRNLDGLMRALWQSARELAAHWPAIASAEASLARPVIADADIARATTDALEGLVRWCAAHRRKLVVSLDEYEKLLDGRSVSRDDGLDLLDFLRGLNQQHPKAFNYVFAGLGRRLANTHRFAGRQNPLFAAYFPFPLGGLGREELGGMVRKLGRRASLEFDHEAVDKIAAESGGHPFLARTLADIVDQQSARERQRAVPVGLKAIHAALPTFEAEAEFVMREIADAVQELGALDGLTPLVDALDGGSWAPLSPAFVEDLRRYGIVEADGTRTRIGVFGRWLHRNVSSSPRIAHG